MANTNETLRDSKRRAMKIAEFRLTNDRERQNCESDLRRNLNVSAEEAKIVTSAYRAQVLPAVAKHEGLTGDDFAKLVRMNGLDPSIITEFAKHGAGHDENTDDDEDEDMDSELDDTEEDREPGTITPAKKSKAKPPFAKGDEMYDTEEDDSPGDEDAEDEEEDAEGDFTHGIVTSRDTDDESDEDEGEDEDSAKFEVEVPTHLAEKFKQYLQEFQETHATDGMTKTDPHADMDMDMDMGEDEDEDSEGDEDLEGSGDYDDLGGYGAMTGRTPDKMPRGFAGDTPQPLSGAADRKGRPTVDKNVLAKRRALREQIMNRAAQHIASPQTAKRDVKHGDDTSGGTYMGHRSTPISKATDAQYHSEEAFPTLQMENSGGNSMRGDNPTFSKLKIPTRNPKNLGLKNSYEAVRKEGPDAGDSVLNYEVDLDDLDWVPSKNADREKPFAIPTQMDQRDRNTNVSNGGRQASNSNYSDKEMGDAEEVIFNALKTVGVREETMGKLTMAKAITLLVQRVAQRTAMNPDVAIEVNAEDESENCEYETKGVKHGDDFKRQPHTSDESRKPHAKEASAEVFKARLKTAWAITSKLCLAGLIAQDEMESNVQMWMNDGMSVTSMISTGTQFLRMASTAGERVLEAATTRNQPSQRTAGIATNPVLTQTYGTGYSAPSYSGGQSDLAQALKSVLSNDNEFAAYDEYVQDRDRR